MEGDRVGFELGFAPTFGGLLLAFPCDVRGEAERELSADSKQFRFYEGYTSSIMGASPWFLIIPAKHPNGFVSNLWK